MRLKNSGVSLIEIAIVIIIFGIVSAGVTHLSIGLIQNQRDEEAMVRENTIYNNIQDDLRADLASAIAVYATENTPTGYKTTFAGDYIVISACAATPDPPHSFSSDVLSIIVQTSYDPSVPSSRYDLVRYKFMTVDGIPSLVRTQNNNQSVGALPGNVWPKCLDTADTNYTAVPSSFGSIAGFTTTMTTINGSANYKMYNSPDSGSEDIQIDAAASGGFQVVYGDQYKPQENISSWYPNPSTNCTYYVKHVNINGLEIRATGYQTKYDKLFGKSQVDAPTLTFEVNPGIKFY